MCTGLPITNLLCSLCAAGARRADLAYRHPALVGGVDDAAHLRARVRLVVEAPGCCHGDLEVGVREVAPRVRAAREPELVPLFVGRDGVALVVLLVDVRSRLLVLAV